MWASVRGEPGGTDCIPPTFLGVILSLIKCYCLSLSLKIIPFTFSVDYLSQLEWCIWHQCSESVRVGRAGLNPSIPTKYYALFSNGGRLDFPQKQCLTWKREISRTRLGLEFRMVVL